MRRWQRVQWQYWAETGGAVTSKRTAPQPHPPVNRKLVAIAAELDLGRQLGQIALGSDPPALGDLDEVIRDRVRAAYARLVTEVERLSQADAERIDEFFRYGMWLNVAAAMGVEDLSVGCEWVQAEQAVADQADSEQVEAERAEPPSPAGR